MSKGRETELEPAKKSNWEKFPMDIRLTPLIDGVCTHKEHRGTEEKKQAHLCSQDPIGLIAPENSLNSGTTNRRAIRIE